MRNANLDSSAMQMWSFPRARRKHQYVARPAGALTGRVDAENSRKRTAGEILIMQPLNGGLSQ